VTLPKPRLVKVAPAVWQCRSIEFWSAAKTFFEAYEKWQAYMKLKPSPPRNPHE
jgi:hypothetical protein